jgi:dihydropyrimidinase
MRKFDTIVRGGRVVTASDTVACDVGIRDGKIVALGDDLGAADAVIDARGRLVLPGGIDSHVHISQPSGPGIVMADDFESGTRAAAFGGNTLVMPFCMQQKGQSLRQAVKDYHALAEGRCHLDVSFHLIISDPTPQVLGQELPALVRDGYTSFKVFMTYQDLALSDIQLLEVFSTARETGALVMVHAENYDAIRFLTQRLERVGHTAPKFHATSRPIPVEREATHRAISLAELVDVPIMIVHVSNGEAMEQIRWAQARGLKVFGETCPQYLVLTEKDMEGLNMEGAKYVCSPPPRDEASQKACWLGLETGVFQVFSSDHCPFRYDDRHTGCGDEAADPVLGGCGEGPHQPQ